MPVDIRVAWAAAMRADKPLALEAHPGAVSIGYETRKAGKRRRGEMAFGWFRLEDLYSEQPVIVVDDGSGQMDRLSWHDFCPERDFTDIYLVGANGQYLGVTLVAAIQAAADAAQQAEEAATEPRHHTAAMHEQLGQLVAAVCGDPAPACSDPGVDAALHALAAFAAPDAAAHYALGNGGSPM